MKTLILATALTGLIATSSAFATHELKQTPDNQEPVDTHLSWHEFRHELLSFPSVIATIDEKGVITLSGHTDSAIEKSQLNKLAARVRGTSDVKNRILTD